MNTERILIYRDRESLNKAEANYSEVKRRLQLLLDAVRALGVIPSIRELKEAFLNNNWTAIVDKLEKPLAELRSASLSEIAKQGIQDSLKAIRDKEAYELQEYWNTMIVSPDLERYYSIQGSSVVLDESHKVELEEKFSVYADSEGRKSVLDAFYKVQTAVEEFERVVKAAPKRDLTEVERMIKAGRALGAQIFPDDLGGLRPTGVFSVACIDADGSMSLRGQNFSNLL